MTFLQWLYGQRGRNDAIGDFAREATADREPRKPRWFHTCEAWEEHLIDTAASEAAIGALRLAWREWGLSSTKAPSGEFGRLAEIEPGLRIMLAHARAMESYPGFCANTVWYGYRHWKGRGLRSRLETLVGWTAQNPALRSSQAYQIAYRTIYAALPNCRHGTGLCGCDEIGGRIRTTANATA